MTTERRSPAPDIEIQHTAAVGCLTVEVDSELPRTMTGPRGLPEDLADAPIDLSEVPGLLRMSGVSGPY